MIEYFTYICNTDKTNNMKLIKLSADHYIIVDDSEIKVDCYALHESPLGEIEIVTANGQCKLDRRITHSTIPLEYSPKIGKYWNKVQPVSISEVKELLGEVDVEKKSVEWYNGNAKYNSNYIADPYSWKEGYNQALEDNKHMRFTYDELLTLALRCWNTASNPMERSVNNLNKIVDEYIQRFETTQWEVEFVDGKIKLI